MQTAECTAAEWWESAMCEAVIFADWNCPRERPCGTMSMQTGRQRPRHYPRPTRPLHSILDSSLLHRLEQAIFDRPTHEAAAACATAHWLLRRSTVIFACWAYGRSRHCLFAAKCSYRFLTAASEVAGGAMWALSCVWNEPCVGDRTVDGSGSVLCRMKRTIWRVRE
jgi:hypothetical protein